MTEEKKVINVNWRDIVNDAKVMKYVDVEWQDTKLRVYYKELVGEEALSIENKFPDNVGKVFYEKTFMMLAKANSDIDDSNARISRQEWDLLPERLRNLIVQKIWQLEKLMQENFQKMQGNQ